MSKPSDSTSDLIAAFLAKGGQVTSCPSRKPSAPSVEWAGFEYGQAEQPNPDAREVREVAALDSKLAHPRLSRPQIDVRVGIS